MSLDVGARLKEVRKKRGLSQRELAKLVLNGVPLSLPAFFADEVPNQQQVFYNSE